MLIVEDTFLIAELIATTLAGNSYTIVGPVPRLREAAALAKSEQLDGALLDLNLHGELCFPVAEALAIRAVPFAFLTGYDNTAFPPAWKGVPCLVKPFELAALTGLAERLFRGRS